MQKHRPRGRAGELVLIGIVLMVAMLAWGGIQLAVAADIEHPQVQVTDGEGQEHLIPLDEDGTYTFTTSLGTNVVRIADGAAHMESSDCPGQDCIGQGSINSPAGIIVCMPHQLVITVVEE